MRRIGMMLLALSVTLAVAGIALAGVGSSFNLNCAYTRTLPDDPIVYPGQPGASHLHDFFGNKTTDAFSTSQSLNAVPTSSSGTSCQNVKDRAGYWAPSAYNGTTQVKPKNIKAYYYHRISGTIEAYPTGLRMLAGFATATTPQPTDRIYFGCGSGTGQSKMSTLPNCTDGNLQIHVIFPDCGAVDANGAALLDSPDHRAHMAYSKSAACPAGYPKHYPQLVMRLNYEIKDARNVTFSCLVAQNPQCVPLSSGSTLGRAPYYTVHSDFFNAWDQTELARLIRTI